MSARQRLARSMNWGATLMVINRRSRNGILPGSPRPCFRSWIPTLSGRSNLRTRRSPRLPPAFRSIGLPQMTARATECGHAGTGAYGLFHAAELELTRWNADGAAALARSLIEIANEHQSATWMTYSVWFVGWLEWRLGNRDAGLSGMRDGRARLAEAGRVYPVSLYGTILAEAEAEAGETDAALATIDRAIAESERTGQRWNAVFEKGSRLPESCPPQAGCWCSRRKRRPYVRLIWCGKRPGCAIGLRTSDAGQTAGD